MNKGFQFIIHLIIIFFLIIALSPKVICQGTFDDIIVDIPAGCNVAFEKKSEISNESVDDIRNNENEIVSFYLRVHDPKGDSLKNFRNWSKKSARFNYNISNEGTPAMINVVFIGLELKKESIVLIARPNERKEYKMLDYFTDIVTQNKDNMFNNLSASKLSLLIIHLKTEEQKDNIKSYFTNSSTKLHSEYIYIIWDKEKIHQLPELFSSLDSKEYQIIVKEKSIISPDINEKVYDPQINSKKVQNPGINIPEKSSIFIKPDPNLPKTITITTTEGKNSERSIPANNLIEVNLLETKSISFGKPYGYNIIKKGESDTTDINNKRFTIIPNPGTIDTIETLPVEFTLIYIDPTNSNNILINNYLDTIANNSKGSIYAYLAWKNKPVIAKDKITIETIRSKIYDLTFESALIDNDLKKITESLAISTISSRMKIHVYLFLPQEGYPENANLFKKKFKTIAPRGKFTYELYLNVSNDEIGEKEEGFNYHFLSD